MHPILLNKPLKELLPAYMINGWIPALASRWQLWAAGLVISIAVAWWGMAPEASKGRRAAGWLGTLASVVFVVFLASLGLRRPNFVVQLHTYGVLVAVGFLLGIILAVREAKRKAENAERILDLAFWILITAMVGARLLYVLIHWKTFKTDWLANEGPWYAAKVFRLWEGGLIFYGGFALALVVVVLFVSLYKLNFWRLADLVIPSVVIGQFFGQIGNYAAGFHTGSASWAMEFKKVAANITLHPTQLYEAVGLLFLFFFLLWMRSEKRYHGQVFLYYLLLYPVLSFATNCFLLKPGSGMLLEAQWKFMGANLSLLSGSQAISLGVFVLAVILMLQKGTEVAAAEA